MSATRNLQALRLLSDQIVSVSMKLDTAAARCGLHGLAGHNAALKDFAAACMRIAIAIDVHADSIKQKTGPKRNATQ